MPETGIQIFKLIDIGKINEDIETKNPVKVKNNDDLKINEFSLYNCKQEIKNRYQKVQANPIKKPSPLLFIHTELGAR